MTRGGGLPHGFSDDGPGGESVIAARGGTNNGFSDERSDGGDGAFERIYRVVRAIPKGKVATYGQVAALAGNPRWSRVVGYALHGNPDPEGIPCFRVVDRRGSCSGSFAFGGLGAQQRLLREDGAVFLPDGRVDLAACRWNPFED